VSPVIAIVRDYFNFSTVIHTHAIAWTCARQATALVSCIDDLGRFGVSLRRRGHSRQCRCWRLGFEPGQVGSQAQVGRLSRLARGGRQAEPTHGLLGQTTKPNNVVKGNCRIAAQPLSTRILGKRLVLTGLAHRGSLQLGELRPPAETGSQVIGYVTQSATERGPTADDHTARLIGRAGARRRRSGRYQ
jgi:hypothetical protein